MDPPRFAPARTELGLVLFAALVAGASALPYAGGWNDGSRLAAAESLGERGTLVIDESIFVRVPPASAVRTAPYRADSPGLQLLGTSDKLLIDGHFYSDKPPVLSVLMGGTYRVWLALGGPSAAERPGLFCRGLTLLTSGSTYAFAVWCVVRLGRRVGLTGSTLLLFGGAFAAGTVVPAYTQHVNGHVVQLGTVAALCLVLAELPPQSVRWRFALAGGLAGFGYTLDLGIGPGFFLATVAYCGAVAGRGAATAVAVAALPWVATHHALNYAVGGTLMPANTVPAYLAWPGSPFTPEIMTGGLKHTPGGFLLYAADLLVGKKGILLLNLPLWLAPGGVVLLWLVRPATRPVLGFALVATGLGWLAYAATSNNCGGMCLSVRWFVPFLAPGFWVVGLVLREFPAYRPDFAWLAAVGAGFAVMMWRAGPWAMTMPAGQWGWVALAGLGWGVVRGRAVLRRRPAGGAISAPTQDTRRAA